MSQVCYCPSSGAGCVRPPAPAELNVRRASHIEGRQALSRLKTNLLIWAGGTILSFVLLFGGTWVAVQIIIHNHYFGTNNKDQLISFFLIQSLVLLSGVAVVVGILVGYIL